MNAFYFGNQGSTLYGVYHPAAASRDIGHGIVLCNAFGQEYIRSHRSYSILANRLATAGFHVLRFDYYGTGDSAGDMNDASISRWLEDIQSAAEELRDYANIQTVSIAGLRLGAALALQADTAEKPFQRIILWEPVTNGGDYLREAQAAHQSWIMDLQPRPPANHIERDEIEISGFPCPLAFRQELENLDLMELSTRPAAQILIVAESADQRYQLLKQQLSRLGASCDIILMKEAAIWRKRSDLNSILVPNSVLSLIINTLNEAKK